MNNSTDLNTVSGAIQATFIEERKSIKASALSKIGIGAAVMVGILSAPGTSVIPSSNTSISISSTPKAYNVGVRMYSNSSFGRTGGSKMNRTVSGSHFNHRKSVPGNVVKGTAVARKVTSLDPVGLPVEPVILNTPFSDPRLVKSKTITIGSSGRGRV